MEQHYMEVNEFDYLANSLLWMLHRHLVVEILWHLINTHIVYHRLSLYLKKKNRNATIRFNLFAITIVSSYRVNFFQMQDAMWGVLHSSMWVIK